MAQAALAKAQMAFDFDAPLAVETPLRAPPLPLAAVPAAVKVALPPPAPVWTPLPLPPKAVPVAHNPEFRPESAMLEGLKSKEAKYSANVEALTLMRELREGKRSATEAEKRTLVRYSGWGAIPNAFAYSPEWEERTTKLKEMLSEKEWEAARESTLNAHYTPFHIIDKIWTVLMHLGFNGGRILEPACGAGHFIGRMPSPIRENSQVTGVELDTASAQLAKLLYPECDIRNQGFEKLSGARGRYDLAIGNVPFGDYRVFDADYDAFKLTIHNYFVMKCVDLVRPGGLVALITSRHTMDASGSARKLRQWLAGKANLLGAFRLPASTFAESANTDVIADLLLFQVGENVAGQSADFIEIKGAQEFDSEVFRSWDHVWVNEHFINHPERVLGKAARGEDRFDKKVLAVEKTPDFEARWASAVGHLSKAIYTPPTPQRLLNDTPIVVADRLLDGDLHRAEDGRLCIIEGGKPVPVADKEANRLGAMYDMARHVRKLLQAQADQGMQETDVEGMREWLNCLYDDYVRKHGYLSRRASFKAVRRWRELPLLLSLELWDDEKEVAKKAPIFTQRTTGGTVRRTKAETLPEALAIAFGESLMVNLPRIAELIGMDVEGVEKALEHEELALFDPGEGRWMIREEFVSGNIRERLIEARNAAQRNPRYERHVTLLESVKPADLTAGDIMVQLGTPWLPVEVIEAFAKDVLGDEYVSVTHSNALAQWSVSGWGTAAARDKWGNAHFKPDALIELALNLREPTVWVPTDDDKRVVDVVQTAGSREKQEAIKNHFKAWVWQDEARTESLVSIYNQRFNSVVPRRFNGDFLTFPDKADNVEFRENQRSAIARYLVSGNTGVFHKTGAGKTMILSAMAHESRRLGLARKTLIVVQNSTLYQFAAEYLRLYPNAEILVPDRDDLSGLNRKAMLAKIAMGDWEAVIVAHSSLEKLPMGEATLDMVRADMTSAVREELRMTQATKEVKSLERQKKQLDAALDALLCKKGGDEHLYFEDLHVDQLMVDEAHRFKNLIFFTKQDRVAGMQQANSKRALDLYAKARWLAVKHGRRWGLVLATATPITNTIAEIYTMQRYLQPDVLQAAGVAHFDAWAAMFGEVVSAVEVSPTGRGFRVNKRFARFHNMAELLRLFLQSADVRQKQHLKGVLKEPEIAGGEPAIEVCTPHPMQAAYIDTLVERAEAVKNREVRPDEDNMLKIVHEGRLIALDMRTLIPEAPYDEGSKVGKCVANIMRHYRETTNALGTQLVFCDLSVPKKDTWSVYQEMADRLIEKGIPSEEIAFAQDYETDARRLKLFKDVRAGRIRVVLGSTERLGTGANVQDRIIAMHHLDVPWRPSDLEQRDGRGIRDGNMWDAVYIYRYVVNDSLDSFMWSTVEVKARFIMQVMDVDMKLRTVEDIAVATLSYAQVKAAACGNPLVVEKIQVDAELAKLELARMAYESDLHRRAWNRSHYTRQIESLTKAIATVDAIIDAWKASPPDSVVIEGQSLSYESASKALAAWIPKNLLDAAYSVEAQKVLGTVGKCKIQADMRRTRFAMSVIFPTDWPTPIALGTAKEAPNIARYLVNLPARAVECREEQEAQLREMQNALKSSQDSANSGWDKQARYDELRARQRLLDEVLEVNVKENTAGLEASTDTSTAPAEEEAETA